MTHALSELRVLFDLDPLLRHVMRVIEGVVSHDRIGVALPAGDDASLETVSVVARPGEPDPARGRFPMAGSVGGWVAQHGLPFIAADYEELARFPVTRDGMIRDGMQSCCVLPIDHRQPGRGMLFLLSRSTSSFTSSHLPTLAHAAGVVEGAVLARRALRSLEELEDRGRMRPEQSGFAEPKLPSLQDVQRNYIGAVLEKTNGVVEGERGAATLLGIAPSTLRHKMGKLGIRKTNPGTPG